MWPERVEKTQSDSRPGGTTIAATKGGLVGGREEESRMATRSRWCSSVGDGRVKMVYREGSIVFKMERSMNVIGTN